MQRPSVNMGSVIGPLVGLRPMWLLCFGSPLRVHLAFYSSTRSSGEVCRSRIVMKVVEQRTGIAEVSGEEIL